MRQTKVFYGIKSVLVTCLCLVLPVIIYAQQSTAVKAVTSATTEINSLFKPSIMLITAIGAIVAAYGAFNAFSKKQHGDPHAEKAMAGWIYACVFFVVAMVLIAIFFNTSGG